MKFLSKLKAWWLKQWAFLPPLESDVVSVSIVRKNNKGELIRYSLEGEDADKWGWLMINKNYRSCSEFKFSDLNWKREKL